MISKTLTAGLLAAGCVTAAAGAAYVGVRQNAVPAPTSIEAQASAPTAPSSPSSGPVSETEAAVEIEPAAVPVEAAVVTPRRQSVARPVAVTARNEASRTRPAVGRQPERRVPSTPPAAVVGVDETPVLPAPALPAPVVPEPERYPESPVAPEPAFDELVIPSSSVIGLQVETSLSSERARVEDRVDARVTRDVLAAGRVAIPAGSRVIGAVTLVERGGKVKERARLGVRFHTVVLANGSQVPLRTEAILREGDAPSGESARKIGGAAVGGAILGAIMGGKKGAIIGGATGAGAGTAAVMAGDRNAATLPAGTIVTVRLSAPAAVDVERRQP